MGQRKCLGLRSDLHRCNNQVDGCHLFCNRHKMQPFGFLFGSLLSILSGLATIAGFLGYDYKSFTSNEKAVLEGKKKETTYSPSFNSMRYKNTTVGESLKAQRTIDFLMVDKNEPNKVRQELKSKDLLLKLEMAEGYVRSANISGEEQAFKLYREVLSSLSQDSLKTLNQELLRDSEDDVKGGHIENALQKYQALFATYMI